MMRALIGITALMLLSGPVLAGDLPAGDPQETRYRKLLQRWYDQPHTVVDPDIKAPTSVVKRWEDLTPQQQADARKKYKQRRKEWAKMTPEERAAARAGMGEGVGAWESLTPEQKAKVIEKAKKTGH